MKLSDTTIKVGAGSIRFIFEKYGDNSLHFELSKLYGNLSSRGYAKSVKGAFVIFIVKKKEKMKWRKLHSEQMSVLRLSSRERGGSRGTFALGLGFGV